MSTEQTTTTVERHPDHDEGRGPLVDVLYVRSLEHAKFHPGWQSTLAQIWDEAYTELGEERKGDDKFQCLGGKTDLTPYLGLTLRQAQEQGICPDHKFQIAGGTGGAEL